MRIQKYLSEQGMCSRREAEEYIRRGLVALNGKVVREMGVLIDPSKDKVEIRQGKKERHTKKTTVIVHKPRGVVSSRNSSEGTTIFDLLPQFAELNIVGRLDKESEGLLMLTNDGVIAKRVTGPAHLVEKEYEVTVQESITPFTIDPFKEGVMLDDGPTLPARVHFLNGHSFRIVLREGRKHQIRRMCEHLHLTVIKLVRLKIGTIALGHLKAAAFRELKEAEIQKLRGEKK